MSFNYGSNQSRHLFFVMIKVKEVTAILHKVFSNYLYRVRHIDIVRKKLIKKIFWQFLINITYFKLIFDPNIVRQIFMMYILFPPQKWLVQDDHLEYIYIL